MKIPFVLLAQFLAVTLLASVFTNAYALSSPTVGEVKQGLPSFYNLNANNNDDNDDEGDNKKGKKGGGENRGKGNNNTSSGSSDDNDNNNDDGDDKKDDEKKSKNKGNKIKVKSNNKGGRGEVAKVEDNESLSQQTSSKSGDRNDDDEEESQSLLFPADFMIKADNGRAIVRGNGGGNTANSLDASINLNATTARLEGNHVRVAVYGTLSLDNKQIPLRDGKGIIIFFNDSGTQLFRGIIHITGTSIDENNKSQKFHLRAFLLPPSEDSDEDGKWAFVVKPAAKFGPKVRVNMLIGELIQLDSDNNTPPPPNNVNKRLDRFAVSVLASSVVAGMPFNVTITALDSDGNILKSYKGKANVSDLTGKVTPSVVSDFVNGVSSSKLNITKAMNSNKLTITDTDTGKKGTSGAFDVLTAQLAKVDLSPSTVTIQPGDKVSFVAKALDTFDNEISPSGFQFGWSLSTANFGSISTAGNAANFTSSSIVTSETSVILTVAIGTLQDSSEITIKPAVASTLDHFIITPISSPKVAGMPFAISITAATSNGTTLTSYTGPIEIDDTTGTLTVTTDNGFSSGIWTGSVNITEAVSGVRINVLDASSNSTRNATSNSFEVVAASLDHFKISEIANQTAGVEFEFTVTAKDVYGNVIKNFNGNVTLSTNVHTSEITPNPYSFNSTATDQGVHTFKAKLYNATEDARITVASSSSNNGSSNNFDVVVGAVDQITISPSDISASPGQNVTFTVEATDAFGNVIEDVMLFNWTLSSPLLGVLNTTTGSTVQFNANTAATETQNGALTATYGEKSATATIQVVV